MGRAMSGLDQGAGAGSGRQILRVDLGSKKAAFEALCAQEGVSISQKARELVMGALGASLGPSKTGAGRGSRIREDESRRRFEILLTDTERAELTRRAEAAGYTLRGYLSAMVRRHLTETALPLGVAELQALSESNARLLAIAQDLRTRSEGEALSAELMGHIKKVAAVLASQERRWFA